MGQFHGLFVGYMRNRLGLFDQFRVGGEHAADVRPDFKYLGIDCGRYDGSSIVGTSPSQGGRTSIFRRSDKAGHDNNLVRYLGKIGSTINIGAFETDTRLSGTITGLY